MTPSDIAPARLSQQQIDELSRHSRIADILPLTPLQQGLLFHANTAQQPDEVYAVQLGFTVTGSLDPTGCARRCTRSSTGIRIWWPDSAHSSTSRYRSFAADPVVPWRYVDLSGRRSAMSMSRFERVCADERAAVCDLASASRYFGWL